RTGYRLQAYWLDSASESVTGSGITITNPYGTQGRASISGSLHVRGGQILDVMNRQRPNDSRQWLYVRCQFEPGNPLLIQLRTRENSSPGFTRRDIAEEHRYFMEANSVSAWFDLSALSREMELKLDVYSLKDLLQQPSPRCIHLEYETTDVTDQASRLKSWEHQ
ncbi:MAG TPA: hypothetical protein PKA06_10520, partial [Gemmatales bacterium]|nr:hypothetical protein [Gemmatales bacterium]